MENSRYLEQDVTKQPYAYTDSDWTDYKLLRERIKDRKDDGAKYFIEHGCRVNNTFETPSDTPLHNAVKNGDAELVEILLSAGAWPEVRNREGKTPLHFAIEAQDNQIIDLILKRVTFTEIDDTAAAKKTKFLSMFKACLKNDAQTVEAFLESGCSVDQCVSETSPYWPGYTLLHFAADYGCFEVAKLLLKHKANVNARNSEGSTPLYLAKQQRNEELTHHIFTRHVFPPKNPNQKVGEPFSFFIACIKGDMNLAADLLKKGAQINSSYKGKVKDWIGYTPLHFAVEFNNKKVVTLLLIHGANEEMKNSKGLTPLALAVKLRKVDIIISILFLRYTSGKNETFDESIYTRLAELIISSGVDVNSADRMGNTLLHLAVKNLIFHPPQLIMKMVNLLLISGADVSIPNFEGLTPLHFAYIEGNKDIINLLASADRSCDKNVNPTDYRGFSHFHAACMRNDVEKVKAFLQNGVEVDARVNPNVPDRSSFIKYKRIFVLDKNARECHIDTVEGKNSDLPSSSPIWSCNYTPLHFCVESKSSDAVDLLVDHSVDINAKNTRGETPLHLASIHFEEQIMRKLVEHGADKKIKCTEGMTPLHLAVLFGNKEAVDYLLSSGAEVDAKDNRGLTPLDSEYSYFFDDIQQSLLQHVKNVNERDEDGMTLLHKVIQRKRLKHVEIVLDQGADINCAEGSEGYTPLHLAVINEVPDILDLLLERGANADARDTTGETALHAIARSPVRKADRGQIISFNKMINSLLNHGCDLEAKDSLGKTPLHTASFKNNINAVRSLLQNGADFSAEDSRGNSPAFYSTDLGVLEVFWEHGLKFDVIGFHMSDKARSTFLDWWWTREENLEFLKLLVEELGEMKQIEIVDSPTSEKEGEFTLYDVLFAKSDEMELIMKSETFQKIVESDAFDQMFPSYGYMIKLQHKKMLTKKDDAAEEPKDTKDTEETEDTEEAKDTEDAKDETKETEE